MEQIKRFVDCYIDTQICNLKCHYCYISLLDNFGDKLVAFPFSATTIAAALSKERLGGTCLLNFCAGGETLLGENVIPVLRALLEEGHYVMVVTNGTVTKRFDEIAKFPADLLKHLFFKFSFHYLELKRLNLFDLYFENINKMREAGCSFTVEITPSDELIPYIDDVKKMCMERLGVLCHVTIARDDRTDGIEVLSKKDWDTYKEIWGTFDSDLFSFKQNIFYKKRKEFCYAGDWSVYVNLTTGDMRQCYCGNVIDNIYKNIDKPLNFQAIGCNCELAHCYNGHAFLTLGVIPDLETVTYDVVRNRIDSQGNEWLTPEMKQFMGQKLVDNNLELSLQEKKRINRIYKYHKLRLLPKRVLGKLGKLGRKIGVK